jgi:hypothetical protein
MKVKFFFCLVIVLSMIANVAFSTTLKSNDNENSVLLDQSFIVSISLISLIILFFIFSLITKGNRIRKREKILQKEGFNLKPIFKFKKSMVLLNPGTGKVIFVDKNCKRTENQYYDEIDKGRIGSKRCWISKDGFKGFADEKGIAAIWPKYSIALPFNNDGLSAVKSADEKWGFIDMKGNYVIDPIYDSVEPEFENGKTFVKKGNESFYINLKGGIIHP